MKFSLSQKVPVDDMIESLRAFLKEKYADYPYTKGSCNIYIKLQDADGASPNNEADYKFDGQTFINIGEKAKAASIENAKTKWQAYIISHDSSPARSRHSIETDTNYLESATEKGRKPENIAKRKAELEKKQQELASIENYIELLHKLDKDAHIKYNIIKYVSKGSSYNYEYVTEIEFQLDNKRYQFTPMPSDAAYYHGAGRLIELKEGSIK